MSCYSNPNTNLVECDKNNGGIKILIVSPHELRVVLHANIIGVQFTQNLRFKLFSCGDQTIRWLQNKILTWLSEYGLFNPKHVPSATVDNVDTQIL